MEKRKKKERKGNLPGHTLTEEGGCVSWLNLRKEEEAFRIHQSTKAKTPP